MFKRIFGKIEKAIVRKIIEIYTRIKKTGQTYKKEIHHEDWLLIRNEPGYVVYNYEYGYKRNPKIEINSPAKETDYIMNDEGHILVRRGLPIGVGSLFTVKVTIK